MRSPLPMEATTRKALKKVTI